jgi:hypothetical protein
VGIALVVLTPTAAKRTWERCTGTSLAIGGHSVFTVGAMSCWAVACGTGDACVVGGGFAREEPLAGSSLRVGGAASLCLVDRTGRCGPTGRIDLPSLMVLIVGAVSRVVRPQPWYSVTAVYTTAAGRGGMGLGPRSKNDRYLYHGDVGPRCGGPSVVSASAGGWCERDSRT